jgi:hypothetical protein
MKYFIVNVIFVMIIFMGGDLIEIRMRGKRFASENNEEPEQHICLLIS